VPTQAEGTYFNLALHLIIEVIMKKTLFLIFTVLMMCQGQLQAQKRGYSEGYIVTLKNDTIYGLIKSKNDVASCRSVTFISDLGQKETYNPRKIKCYSKTRKIYRSFLLPANLLGMHAFIKELVYGRMTLYVHYQNRQNNMMTAGGQSMYGGTTVIETYYLGSPNNKKLTMVRHLNFKAQLSEYVKDDIGLSARILNKEFRYGDIKEIVKMYNQGYNPDTRR
jgi:hypothetical protein